MKNKMLILVLAIALAFVPITSVSALSPGDLFNPVLEFQVPDFSLLYPINPLILTPYMGLDFSFRPINDAVMDSLYTNDLFYVEASMMTAPADLATPYTGIKSGGIIKFTYRYNKNIVKLEEPVLINTAFSMVGSLTHTTIDATTGIMEVSFDVSMDQAHIGGDIVGKIISQVKFKVLETGYGDSTVLASAWTKDAYERKMVGTKMLGGIIIPIFDDVPENRANYETLSFIVKSLTINLKDSGNAFLTPAYQVPYPADNKVKAPAVVGYKCISGSPLDVFDSLGQRRLLAVFNYEEVVAPPVVTDVTINCYFDLEPPIIYTKTMTYPTSGYVFAPNLESEGFTLLDDFTYQEVDPGDIVIFRYIENAMGTHTAYITGYPDSTVRPEKGITREEIAAILYRLIKDPNKASFVRKGTMFSDVRLNSPGLWGGKEIEYVAKVGLFDGYPDGTFLPKKNISREEFVTVLTRFANYRPTTVPIINTNNWSKENVSLAVASGYTKGLTNSPAGEYWLNASWRTTPTTRAEVIVMFNNAFNRSLSPASAGLGVSPFTDLPTSYWAFYDIIEATSAHKYDRNSDGSENHIN